MQINLQVRRSWNFRFDWFIKSRTPKELENRFKQLVRLIEKELEAEDAGKANKASVIVFMCVFIFCVSLYL